MPGKKWQGARRGGGSALWRRGRQEFPESGAFASISPVPSGKITVWLAARGDAWTGI